MIFLIIYIFASLMNLLLVAFGIKRILSVSIDCGKIDISQLKKLQSDFSQAAFDSLMTEWNISNIFVRDELIKVLTANKKGLQITKRNFLDGMSKYCLSLGRLFRLITNLLIVVAVAIVIYSYTPMIDLLWIYILIFLILHATHIVVELFFVNRKMDPILEKFSAVYSSVYVNAFDNEVSMNLLLSNTYNEIIERNKCFEEKHTQNQEIIKALSNFTDVGTDVKGQVSDYIKRVINCEDTEIITRVVGELKDSIKDMTSSYQEIFKTSENYEKEILKYTEFFKNFNEIGEAYKQTALELENVLKEIEQASNLSTKDQVTNIEANLRKIIVKQINELKDIVNQYNENIFGRISYVMNNNLERSTQTLSTMRDIYEQNEKQLSLLGDYINQVEACTTANVLHNQKVFSLVDANIQLVGFILKRYKFVDGNMLNKFKTMVLTSPIDETNSHLEYLSKEINTLNQRINKLRS